MASPASSSQHIKKQGLAYWMRRVLRQARAAEQGFGEEAVHDLRTALRRCRTMAAALVTIDPDPAWPAMRKAGRRLFRRLGELRDVHIMIGWVERLSSPGLPGGTENSDGSLSSLASRLLSHLRQSETNLKQRARKALARFDRRQWRAWAAHLDERASAMEPGSAVFRLLALERWQAAHELHRRALQNRSRAAWHELRISVKRFRYVVENFLPSEHGAWGTDLKLIQDVLGDVHDLDVLWEAISRGHLAATPAERAAWQEAIGRERETRLRIYREKMSGRASLWRVWRAGLPHGQELQEAALEKLRAWASLRDPDFANTQHVTRLALHLYDAIAAQHLPGPYRDARWRYLLHAAGLVHNAGRVSGHKGHHKESYRLVHELEPPPGWSKADVEVVALVARYHRGAPPAGRHAGFSRLTPLQQEMVVHLAGLLRLAAAFDSEHDSAVRAVDVQDQPEALLVWAQGYTGAGAQARVIAAERHLLERALRKPVMIRPHRVAAEAAHDARVSRKPAS